MQHAVKWTSEYEQWYKSKPKPSDTEKLQLSMASATLDTYEALPQLLVPFEDDSYTAVGKLLTHAHRIDGIQPATFILDLSSAMDIDLPEFLLSFTGLVILQPVAEEESTPHPSIRFVWFCLLRAKGELLDLHEILIVEVSEERRLTPKLPAFRSK